MGSDPIKGEATILLQSIAQGDQQAAASLLPLVYGELRRLAHARLAQNSASPTLQATALVHEVYLKLVGSSDPGWEGRSHFFGAAAKAMREIIVDHARHKAALKRGGGRSRVDLELAEVALDRPAENVLALDEALKRLEVQHPRKAQMVMFRCFAGLTQAETAAALEISEGTVERDWKFIRAWMHAEMSGESTDKAPSP